MDPRRMKGLLGREDWLKDLILFYNFCFAREDDAQFIEQSSGVPSVEFPTRCTVRCTPITHI